MTGLRITSCPFDRVEVDPHVQAFPDFDHFFDLGLSLRLLNYITPNLTESQEQDIQTRLQCLSTPRGWNKIKLDLHGTSKKRKPMSYIKKLLVLGLYLFRGFIDKAVQSLLVNLIHLRGWR